MLAIALHFGHSAEELFGGFNARFPALLGLPPWSLAFFVSFNLFWIAVWALSIFGLRARIRAALFPVWFLAIGSAANGLEHPAFAAIQGSYFPGLWTSPFVGIVGLLLLHRLTVFTRGS
jgi:hypothetical protein